MNSNLALTSEQILINEQIKHISVQLANNGVESMEDLPQWSLFISSFELAKLPRSDQARASKLVVAQGYLQHCTAELREKGIDSESINNLISAFQDVLHAIQESLEQQSPQFKI